MAEDFRKLLVEVHRIGDEERWFDDIQIGNNFIFSVQASPLHDCKPLEMLDPMEYEEFQVFLQAKPGLVLVGKYGAWTALSSKPWHKYFEDDVAKQVIAKNVPVKMVQEIYEDLLQYTEEHPNPGLKKRVCKGCKSDK